MILEEFRDVVVATFAGQHTFLTEDIEPIISNRSCPHLILSNTL